MSGHSKWHNIKRKKEVTDAKRSKEFSKYSKLISVAAKLGGGDINANPNLRLIVQKAKEQNMPKDNIEKAIKKGTGELEGFSYEEVHYECFGPFGGAIILKTVTDNRNRTVSELRNVLSRAGGGVGSTGSASYVFTGEGGTPNFYITLEDEEQAQKVADLLDELSEHDDVESMKHNYEGFE